MTEKTDDDIIITDGTIQDVNEDNIFDTLAPINNKQKDSNNALAINDDYFQQAMKFQQIMMIYESAIKQIETKLDILNNTAWQPLRSDIPPTQGLSLFPFV